MVGTSTDDAGRPAEILGYGNHDVPDAGRGLQAATAPDARVDAGHRQAHGIGNSMPPSRLSEVFFENLMLAAGAI